MDNFQSFWDDCQIGQIEIRGVDMTPHHPVVEFFAMTEDYPRRQPQQLRIEGQVGEFYTACSSDIAAADLRDTTVLWRRDNFGG